ncbi:MAG: 30S ribosomal protein S11 [bacterium]|nr:30S ribosomal protein S11 [bacterium]
MGKKKVGKEDQGALLKEAGKVETAVAAAAGVNVTKRANRGNVYVKASYNNTIISVTDEKGNLLFWNTAGSLGFTGPKKATPFAASKIVAALTEKMKKTGMGDITIYLNGIGGGRDSTVRSFVNQGFNILAIKDVTPMPHNGPKPKKIRRI